MLKFLKNINKILYNCNKQRYNMVSTIIILTLIVFGLGFSLGKHSERNPDFSCEYNFWAELFVDIIFVDIILLTLFYNAGLFDKFFS